MTRRLEGFTFIRPAPRCTIQRLPHLLRLLLMYQDNPNRASVGEIFFWQIVHALAVPQFLLILVEERSFKALKKGSSKSLPCAAGLPAAAEKRVLNP